jgi:membrane protease subunit (stomatin/prohibitin family)
MPWFDRALKSVQGTAEKAAFEADKLVRVRREEGALTDMQARTQTKLAELGQAALALYRSGSLADPSLEGLAHEIADLEAQVKAQQAKIEAVRTEQYQAPGEAPAQPPPPAAPYTPPAPVQPTLPEAPVAMAAPEVDEPASFTAPLETVECPNCHTQVKATAAFCPECGNKMK